MNEILTKNKEFKDLVHMIRGQQVMLDSDLAALYGTEVRKLNQQVKRNIDRFPDDFVFQLTRDEVEKLVKSQNVTSPENAIFKGQDGGRRKLPYAFTEEGTNMLATVVKNAIAAKQSVYIMRSFKKMRHYIMENQVLLNNADIQSINYRLDKQDSLISKIMENFLNDTPVKEITFLEGQKFEANEAYINIYKQAKQTIYVIDNYIDMDTLSLLRYKQKNVDVIIFTANKGVLKLHKLEVDNFCNEYPSLCIKKAKEFHDRYIILDYDTKDEIMYHCGHSSKDTGNKVSTIHLMLDKEVMHPLIDSILENDDIVLR